MVIALEQTEMIEARMKSERNGTKLAPQKLSLICE